ncbi:MAG: serine/threonine protein kinase [Gammaproteobacteria bacterium]
MEDAPDSAPYHQLGPDTVLTAVESCGYRTDGHFLALNSYENRVYQIGLEDEPPLVAKFYRPGRWSDDAILEEHRFALELAEHEIPVVAPLPDRDGTTLHRYKGFRFALFPRRGGRWPELDQRDNRLWLGRFIGRIHAVGAVRPFEYRPALDSRSFGTDSVRFILENRLIPGHVEEAYRTLTEDLLTQIEGRFEMVGALRRLRLHGDCHPGNILWTDAGPHFVDLDDCRSGPAVQDLWMLLSGAREEMAVQLGDIIEGYTQFFDFDPVELHLIEPLRTLRMLHYAAWLARRWSDPAFPMAFPWFGSPRYWEDHILALREQAAALDEPPLPV